MKRTICLLCIVAVTFVMAAAQTQDEKDVASAVDRLRRAMVDADGNTLRDLTSTSLSYGHSGGKVEDQPEFVEAIASGKSDFSNIDLSGQTIRITGNTAIVRHKLSGNVTDNGQSLSVNLNIMMIWQKEAGQWKLLARHASRIQ